MNITNLMNKADIITVLIWFWLWVQFIQTGILEYIWLSIAFNFGYTFALFLRAYAYQLVNDGTYGLSDE